jgi:hypothetical protein
MVGILRQFVALFRLIDARELLGASKDAFIRRRNHRF